MEGSNRMIIMRQWGPLDTSQTNFGHQPLFLNDIVAWQNQIYIEISTWSYSRCEIPVANHWLGDRDKHNVKSSSFMLVTCIVYLNYLKKSDFFFSSGIKVLLWNWKKKIMQLHFYISALSYYVSLKNVDFKFSLRCTSLPWQLCELTECVAVETSLDQCTRETGHWSSRRKLLSEQMDLNWKPWLRWSKQCQLTWQYPLRSRTSILPPKAYLWTTLPCLLQTMTEVPL